MPTSLGIIRIMGTRMIPLSEKSLEFKGLIRFARRHVVRNETDLSPDFIYAHDRFARQQKIPLGWRCAVLPPSSGCGGGPFADNKRARVAALAPSAEMPGKGGGGGGEEIAYQAWEEDRSVDPGVVLAVSLTESGCTARWPRSRRVPLCIIFSFPRPACSPFPSPPSLSLSLAPSLSSFFPIIIFIRSGNLHSSCAFVTSVIATK